MSITYIDTPIPIMETTGTVFELGDVIRKLRAEKGWSLDDLAEKSGVNRMSISQIERGTVDPRVSTIERIATALGFQNVEQLHAEVRRGTDPSSHTSTGQRDEHAPEPFDRDITRGYKKHDVPVVGDAEASANGIISWDDGGVVAQQIEQWVSRSFADGDPKAYALRVRGDSMVPRYFPGEVVIAQPRLTPKDGDFACVQLVNGERLVKRVFRTPTGWVLRSLNEAYPPREVTLAEVHAVHVIRHSVARM